MRIEGKLKTWNDDRGFGFIEPNPGGQEIFVHIKAFPPRSGRPKIAELVSFEIEMGPQGKKRARNARVIQVRRPQPRLPSERQLAAQRAGATLFVLPAFVIAYLAIAALWRPPSGLQACTPP